MAIIRANNNTLSSVTALPNIITTGGLVKLSHSDTTISLVAFDNTISFTDTYNLLSNYYKLWILNHSILR